MILSHDSENYKLYCVLMKAKRFLSKWCFVVLMSSLILMPSCRQSNDAFASSSIQKRKYMKGFWLASKESKSENLEKREIQVDLVDMPGMNHEDHTAFVATRSNLNTPNGFKPEEVDLEGLGLMQALIEIDHSEPKECDEIIFRNGDILSAKIEEIGPSEIKYRKCDFLDGPLYRCEKADVFLVRYSNGTTEKFETEEDIRRYQPDKRALDNDAESVSEGTVNGLAIASFATVITATAVFWWVSMLAGIIGFVLALVFATIALKENQGEKARGLGVAGFYIALLSIMSGIFYAYIYANF